jgi:phosphate transport system substrate-binding protein
MALFASAYALSCRGRDLRYTSTGSTVGRSEFISGKTDFGGSDSPLGIERGETERAKSRCGGQEAWNLPVVFGAIAIVYNLPGIDSLVGCSRD